MKAAVFKKRDEMAVIDVPNPVAGAGEVVLKVHNCGICGSDLHAVQYGLGMAADTVMGHEFCGEISSMGDGVNGFQLGDRVTSLPYIACGVCAWCRRDDAMHCSKLRSLGLGQLPGAYAEYVACGAASLLKLPDNVSSQAGALVEPLSVGLHGVNHSTIEPGMGVVVMGAGPIGLSALIWAKAKGASAVVVSELAAGRTEVAMKLGASAVVNPTESDPADAVKEITGRPPEIVFECIGVKSTLGAAIGMVGRHGQVVVIGVCLESDSIYPAELRDERSANQFRTRLHARRIPGDDRRAVEGHYRRDADDHRRDRRRAGARDVRGAEASGHSREGDGGVSALRRCVRRRFRSRSGSKE